MYVGEAGNGDRDKWYQMIPRPSEKMRDDEGWVERIGNDLKFQDGTAAL